MATTLCVKRELKGVVLYSSVELCRRLQLARHRVVYASTKDSQSLAESCGLTFRELGSDGFEPFRRREEERGWLDRLRPRAARREEARRATG